MKEMIKPDAVEVQSQLQDGEKETLMIGAKARLQAVSVCPECPTILRKVLHQWTVWQKRFGSNQLRAGQLRNLVVADLIASRNYY
jgi:hypothetical protein